MSITRLIQSASELHALKGEASYAQHAFETARANFRNQTDDMSEDEWREITGNYSRAIVDLNRIKTRARVLRGRIHFDIDTL